MVDGTPTTIRIGSSDTTSYIVIGLMPFTEYRFQIAEVNSDDPGPCTALIGPIRINEDGRLKFNLAMLLCLIYNSLTKILCRTGSCIRSDRPCQVLQRWRYPGVHLKCLMGSLQAMISCTQWMVAPTLLLPVWWPPRTSQLILYQTWNHTLPSPTSQLTLG